MNLSMKGIVKSFGANDVLRQVDFSLQPGEICALLDICAARLQRMAAVLVLAALIAAAAKSVSLSAANTALPPASHTLVALKIKLSN